MAAVFQNGYHLYHKNGNLTHIIDQQLKSSNKVLLILASQISVELNGLLNLYLTEVICILHIAVTYIACN